jgi:hypothetical protein
MGTKAHNMNTFFVKPNKYFNSGTIFLKLNSFVKKHTINANGIAQV